MIDDDFDIWDSDEILGDESYPSTESLPKPKPGSARQRYERLLEERRLRKLLEDDLGY